jgi:hypothetical protein
MLAGPAPRVLGMIRAAYGGRCGTIPAGHGPGGGKRRPVNPVPLRRHHERRYAALTCGFLRYHPRLAVNEGCGGGISANGGPANAGADVHDAA